MVVNSAPLFLYLFVALPMYQLLQMGGSSNGSDMSNFFGNGFLWAGLAYPLVLAFYHFASVLSFRKGNAKGAMMNQLMMSGYLVLLLAYGLIGFGGELTS